MVNILILCKNRANTCDLMGKYSKLSIAFLPDKCIINIEGEFMKHEITSMNTKKLLSASLKKIMEKKNLSKITVSEIINDCGVNRKTFYYHFRNIYDLLKWTLELETVEVLKNFDLFHNPEKALLFIINYVDNNCHILNCAYNSIGRDGMKNFFYTDFYNIVLSIIDRIEKEQEVSLPEEFKKYLTKFYTKALSGILIDYFQNKSEIDRDKLITDTLFILKHSIPSIFKAYQNE